MQIEVLRYGERKPLWLIAQRVGAQLDKHLSQEVVAAEAVVVPHGDLEVPSAQLGPAHCRVDERLSPPRLESVGQRFGTTL